MTAPKCRCSHVRHVGRCPLLSCACSTYRPVDDLTAAIARHPAGKGLTELPQTADIYDYLRLKGEL